MTLKFDRDAEEQFLNKPVILEVAGKITDFAKSVYSHRHYKNGKIGLRVVWRPLDAFRAGAYETESGNHEIRLTYGTAIEIYRDAFLLPETCRRALTEGTFDPIYNLLSYGNAREDVLPAGLSPENAKIAIIRLMSTWLYLHEQAHLLQRHRHVAMMQGASELLSNEGIVDSVESGPRLGGRDAAMRHAFEFAADYEAITNLMMDEARDGISQDKLWCLAAGLMCMFLRFYGDSSTVVDALPTGAHPHPGLRMRMMMNKIEQLLSMSDFAEAAKWEGGAPQARAVMDHAVYTAHVYWHLRYLGLNARSPFLDTVVANLMVPQSYQAAVFGIWQTVRSPIVDGHLGHGEAVVMFWSKPAVVGTRA